MFQNHQIDRISFDVFQSMHDFGLDVRLGASTMDGKILIAKVELEEFERGEMHRAGMQFTKPEAQMLMDALWAAGITPTEHGSPGQLAATERHRDDLRKIAFKKLGIEE